MVLLWLALVCASTLIAHVPAQPGMDNAGDKDTQCHVCGALVNETVKKLQPMLNAGTTYPISKSLEDVCGSKNFYIYNFAPPTVSAPLCVSQLLTAIAGEPGMRCFGTQMAKACEIFLDNHDALEILESALSQEVKRAKKAGAKTMVDREALEQRICYESTVQPPVCTLQRKLNNLWLEQEVSVGANLEAKPGTPQVLVDGKPHDPNQRLEL